jgi:dephospho-CoA kinase
MLVIALTGGIGAGKSTVAKRFAELGVPVIDADMLAREQVRPGSTGLEEIVRGFGPEVLTASGELDRGRLRRLIFHDPAAKKRLEAILHPRIRAQMQRRVSEIDAPYVVLVIPLLVENAQTDLADRVLVVDAPEGLQIERVHRRDQQSTEEIQAILGAQCSRAERLGVAHDLITNDGPLQKLLGDTTALHHRYMSLARNKKNI